MLNMSNFYEEGYEARRYNNNQRRIAPIHPLPPLPLLPLDP